MEIFIISPYYAIIKDVTYLLIALIGVFVACKGLSTWRRRLKGNVEHETGRRLYRAILKLRDAMGYVRNPAIWPSEFIEAGAKYPKEDRGTANAVYRMRWEKMIEALSELQAEQLEGEVLWGKEIIKKLNPIRTCVTKLNIAVSDLLRPANSRIRSSEDIRQVIYELRTEQETDMFSQEIDAAVNIAGDFLKQKYNFPEK